MKRCVFLAALIAALLVCQNALGAIDVRKWAEDPEGKAVPLLNIFTSYESQDGIVATVYSGPGEEYAVLDENYEVYDYNVAGTTGDWALIRYDYDKIGYVRKQLIEDCSEVEQLVFANVTETAPNDCVLMENMSAIRDDEIRGLLRGDNRYLGIINEGDPIILLAQYDGFMYVEAKLNGTPVRGFLRQEDYSQDSWRRALEGAGFFFGSDVDLKALYAEQYAVYKRGAVAAGLDFIVGLKSDGTCVAKGRNDDGQCDVDEWTDIVALSAGTNHTVGLRADGTVVATGCNDHGECDVNVWREIVAVSAGHEHTVGLTSDGRVVATGDNRLHQTDLGAWWGENIVAVCAGGYYTAGLTGDGRVLCQGWYYDPAYEYGVFDIKNIHGITLDTDTWRNVVDISAGSDYIIGLRQDGVVIGDGETCNCELDYVEIFNVNAPADDQSSYATAIAAGSSACLLSEDGVLKSSWYEDDTWQDVLFVDASNSQAAGVQKDGTVKLILDQNYYLWGDEAEGISVIDSEVIQETDSPWDRIKIQYDVDDWDNIGLPEDAEVFSDEFGWF